MQREDLWWKLGVQVFVLLCKWSASMDVQDCSNIHNLIAWDENVANENAMGIWHHIFVVRS